VTFVKIKLGEESVKGFLLTLAIKLDKDKKLTIIDTTILNNYFEVRKANIEVLAEISESLNT
jgi:hypothetical protein